MLWSTPLERMQFLTVLLVAPKPAPAEESHITAVADAVLVLVRLRSRDAVEFGAQLLLVVDPIDPSRMMKFAPFSLTMEVVELALITVFARVGLMVKVLMVLAKVFALMLMGNVSEG